MAASAFAVLAEGASGRPSPVLVLGTAVAALLLALVVWPVVGHAITIAHEGGHALFGSMFGGRVTSVLLYRSRAGLTGVAGTGVFGTFFTALAGYVGPSLFGLLGAVLLTQGRTKAVLWLSLAFLLVMLFQIGNLFGLVSVLGTGAAIFWVARYTSGDVQTVFAYLWIWFLLIGGFFHVVEFRRQRRERGDTGSDATALRELTYLPAALWAGFFWLATFAALVFGSAILLGFVGRPV